MDEQGSRQTVIDAVRRAIGDRREAGAPPDRLVPRAAGSVPRAALIDRFVARAEAANAFVSVASDYVGALQRVADILVDLDARQAIVSDDAWQPPWQVAKLPDVMEDCTIRPTSSLHDTSSPTVASFAYVGITAAVCGIAETGTIVVCSAEGGGRIESLLPPVHIALLPAGALVPGLPEAFAALRGAGQFGRSSAVTFITGPSRTADIELTLTLGVHGPRQLYVVLVRG